MTRRWRGRCGWRTWRRTRSSRSWRTWVKGGRGGVCVQGRLLACGRWVDRRRADDAVVHQGEWAWVSRAGRGAVAVRASARCRSHYVNIIGKRSEMAPPHPTPPCLYACSSCLPPQLPPALRRKVVEVLREQARVEHEAVAAGAPHPGPQHPGADAHPSPPRREGLLHPPAPRRSGSGRTSHSGNVVLTTEYRPDTGSSGGEAVGVRPGSRPAGQQQQQEQLPAGGPAAAHAPPSYTSSAHHPPAQAPAPAAVSASAPSVSAQHSHDLLGMGSGELPRAASATPAAAPAPAPQPPMDDLLGFGDVPAAAAAAPSAASSTATSNRPSVSGTPAAAPPPPSPPQPPAAAVPTVIHVDDLDDFLSGGAAASASAAPPPAHASSMHPSTSAPALGKATASPASAGAGSRVGGGASSAALFDMLHDDDDGLGGLDLDGVDVSGYSDLYKGEQGHENEPELRKRLRAQVGEGEGEGRGAGGGRGGRETLMRCKALAMRYREGATEGVSERRIVRCGKGSCGVRLWPCDVANLQQWCRRALHPALCGSDLPCCSCLPASSRGSVLSDCNADDIWRACVSSPTALTHYSLPWALSLVPPPPQREAAKHAKMKAALAEKLAMEAEEAARREQQVALKDQYKTNIESWRNKNKVREWRAGYGRVVMAEGAGVLGRHGEEGAQGACGEADRARLARRSEAGGPWACGWQQAAGRSHGKVPNSAREGGAFVLRAYVCGNSWVRS